MLTADELDDARDDLAAELPDRITVRWKDGKTLDEDPQSPTYLQEVDNWVNRHTGLPALVVKSIQSERVVVQGEAPAILRTYEVTVPVVHEDTTTVVAEADQVVVESSEDPECEGAELLVRDVKMGSLSISRRLLCQQEA